MTILNVVGAVIGVASSVVVAYFFGTSRALEIYFAAATLLALTTSLTQTGQLSEIFLPVYHRIKHDEGIERAQRAFSIILNWMMISVAVLSLVLWVLTPVLVRLLVPGFGTEDRVLCARMFRWLLPILGVQVALSLVRTLANAERWFGKPEAIGVGARASVLVGIAALAHPFGTWAMVAALWIGQGLHVLGYAIMLPRLGYRYRFCLRQEGFSAWSVFSKLFATLGYAGATQVYGFVLNAALSLLPQGTYAVFKYVQQLYARTRGVFIRPISVVFFTQFSESLARGAENVKAFARAALSRCLGISSLAIVAIVVAGQPLLSGLWGSKRFGPEHLDLAAMLLAVFYVLLLASALGQIGRKMTISLGMVGRQYLSTSAVQVLSAACAWGLISYFGVPGAMATVVFNSAALASAPLIVLLVWRKDMVPFYPVDRIARWIVSAMAGLAAGFCLKWFMAGPPLDGRIGQLLLAAMLGGSAALVSLLVAWLVNVYEVRESCRRLLGWAGIVPLQQTHKKEV